MNGRFVSERIGPDSDRHPPKDAEKPNVGRVDRAGEDDKEGNPENETSDDRRGSPADSPRDADA